MRLTFSFPLALGILLTPLSGCSANEPSTYQTSTHPQRQDYLTLKALLNEPLTDNNQQKIQHLLKDLKGYPLETVAQYHWLMKKPNLSDQEITVLQQKAPNFLSLAPLRHRWLLQQAQRKNWQGILDHQQTMPSNPYSQCLIMQAHLKNNGQNKIKTFMDKLWLTGNALPKDCDPLISYWTNQGYLTPSLLQQRGFLAFAKNNQSLLQYLTKIAHDKPSKDKLNHYLRLRKNPQILLKETDPLSAKNLAQLKGGKAMMLTIFPQFVRTLSSATPHSQFTFNTLAQWEKAFKLTESEKRQWKIILLKHYFDSPHPSLQQWRDSQLIALKNDSLTERRIRVAMRQQEDIKPWLNRLSQSYQNKQEWRFWSAYIQNNSQGKKIWTSLAQERGFYPMLAAQMLNIDYRPAMSHYNNQPTLTKTDKQKLAMIRELYATNETAFIFKAWFNLLSGKSKEQKLALSHYAGTQGWYDLQVETTIQAKAWGHVPLRLPNAHQEWFDHSLKGKNIRRTFAMAIARQESAWRSSAKSPANAYGLMQLLPTTAKATAQKYHLPFNGTQTLLEPKQNIMLGSHFLETLHEMFGDNRILIAASYNAGKSRVDRWLSHANGKMDMATFIATIPYLETRRYVQNVLLYDYYYQMLQKEPLQKFSQAEWQRQY